MSNSVRPHRRQSTRLPCPWDSPGKNTGVGCHFLLQCMKVKSEGEVIQLCPILSHPMDCSLPDSSVHGIFQARVLEWGATAFSASRPNLNTIRFQMLSHWEFQFRHELERTFHNNLLLAWMLQVSFPNSTFLGLNKTMILMQSNVLILFLIIVCASMVLLGSLSLLQSHNLLYLFKIFIHLFSCTESSLLHGLCLIAVSRGCSSLQCVGFSRWLLLLQSTGSS